MIRISLNQIEPGMVLAVAIPHPQQPDQTLLQEGYPLDGDIIAQLNRFSIDNIWIKHPGFDFLDDQLDRGLIKRRVQLYETVKSSFEQIAERTPGSFDLLVYKRAVSILVLDLIANKKNAVWADRMMNDDTELFEHSANVAYLSLVIGMKMVNYIASERNHVTGSLAENLANLGIGGMLHDIGKLMLPDELKRIHCTDPEADSDEYRSHVQKGHAALRGRVEATAATRHPQPPSTLRRHRIPRTRLQADRHSRTPGRKRHPHLQSNRRRRKHPRQPCSPQATESVKPSSRHLPNSAPSDRRACSTPSSSETALRAIPPFPPGDIVELSDGKQAVVTRLTRWPCRPIVRPVEGMQPTDDPEIDLSVPGAPSIAAALGTPVAHYLY